MQFEESVTKSCCTILTTTISETQEFSICELFEIYYSPPLPAHSSFTVRSRSGHKRRTNRQNSSAASRGIFPKGRQRYLNLRKAQITDRSSSSPTYISSR